MPKRRMRSPFVVAHAYTDPSNPQINHTVIYHDPEGPPRTHRDHLGLREVVEGAWDESAVAHHLYRFAEYRSVGEPHLVGTRPHIAWLPNGTQVTTITVPVKLRQHRR